MAILWADGFDDWTAATGLAGEYENNTATAFTTTPATAGRRGGPCLQMANYQDMITKQLGGAYTELFASVAYKPGSGTSAGMVLQWWNASGAISCLRWNTNGSLSAMSGGTGGTVLATSAASLCPANVFSHIQLRTVFATTGGIMQVRLNGKPALVLDTTGNTGASCTAVNLYAYGASMSFWWDDFVVNDTSGSVANGWLGDVRVDSYRPNANGDLSQMVGSDGNSTDNFQLVSPAAPAATYAQSAVVGAEDLYQMPDLPSTPSAIYGVIATAAALKDDVGYRAIKLRARSGGVDAESAEYVLNTSRIRYISRFEVDPNTGLAWTRDGFNAAQFGVKVSA